MIQLDNLVKVTENVAPPQLYRYNRFVSATVSSGLNKGYTIGDGLDEMDRIASEVLMVASAPLFPASRKSSVRVLPV